MDTFWGLFFAVAAAISWGVNSHLLHSGAQNDSPLIGLIYRAIISFPILLLLTALRSGISSLSIYFNSENIVFTILLTVSILVGDGIFILSMKKYSVSTILPIATTYPLLTSFILIIFGLEELTNFIIFGTIAVVIGIAMVTKYRYNTVTKEQGVSLEAFLMGIGVSLGWGSTLIFGRAILENDGTDSFGLMSIRTLGIGIIATLIFFSSAINRASFRTQTSIERKRSFRIFSLSGIFGWVMGATFLFLAIELVKTSVATPISASNPVVAVIIGQVLGIDKINMKQFAGILTATFGVILIVV